MDDKDARVSSPVTVRSLVDGGTEQDRLAAVDSLQWVSTNLGEERIGLDFSRHGLALEIELFGGVLSTRRVSSTRSAFQKAALTPRISGRLYIGRLTLLWFDAPSADISKPRMSFFRSLRQ